MTESLITTEIPTSLVTALEPQATPPSAETQAHKKADRHLAVQGVLEKLFGFYPHLFGATFLPLKLGIYQELLAAHPEDLPRDALKAALGVHTRSTRYLQCIAAGIPRHDLAGVSGDAVAPEHIYFALLELFRRRQHRAREDLRPQFRTQLMAAFEASGMDRQDYMAKVQNGDLEATALLEEAFAERDQRLAKQDALLRAYDTSGKSPLEFADLYGLKLRDIDQAIAQRKAPNTV